MTFKATELRELVCDRVGMLDGKPAQVLEDTMTGKGRWSTAHRVVFVYCGKTYATTYSESATEYQDEKPFDYLDVVECPEVVAREKTIIEYIPA